MLVLTAFVSRAAAAPRAACARVSIEGEVSVGGQWSAPLGEGWVFRVLPIAPVQASYSGWDLSVDREPPAGFPDALLLATMPYNSINEREIGTTFGLRAQDAIGWNPRSFRFISNPEDFRAAQLLFRSLMARSSQGSTGDPKLATGPMARLLEIQKHAATGEFRILDARIVPGVADPAPFAQAWALALSRTPHEIEAAPGGKSSALGALTWMRFSVVLWLPEHWKLSPGVRAQPAPCAR